MQFSTILTILVAVAAVEAVPRRGGGIRPGKGGSSGGGSSGGGSIGGGSSGAINNAAKSEKANQKLSAIEGLSLAIDTVGLAVALKDTFSGNPGKSHIQSIRCIPQHLANFPAFYRQMRGPRQGN